MISKEEITENVVDLMVALKDTKAHQTATIAGFVVRVFHVNQRVFYSIGCDQFGTFSPMLASGWIFDHQGKENLCIFCGSSKPFDQSCGCFDNGDE